MSLEAPEDLKAEGRDEKVTEVVKKNPEDVKASGHVGKESKEKEKNANDEVFTPSDPEASGDFGFVHVHVANTARRGDHESARDSSSPSLTLSWPICLHTLIIVFVKFY